MLQYIVLFSGGHLNNKNTIQYFQYEISHIISEWLGCRKPSANCLISFSLHHTLYSSHIPDDMMFLEYARRTAYYLEQFFFECSINHKQKPIWIACIFVAHEIFIVFFCVYVLVSCMPSPHSQPQKAIDYRKRENIANAQLSTIFVFEIDSRLYKGILTYWPNQSSNTCAVCTLKLFAFWIAFFIVNPMILMNMLHFICFISWLFDDQENMRRI